MRIRSAIILKEENKVLFLKYTYNNHDVYSLPGGNPENNETLEETCIREIKEELSVEIEVIGLKVVALGQVNNPKNPKSVIHFIFEGKIVSGMPKINKEHTSANELKWIEESEMAHFNLYPNLNNIYQALDSQKPRSTTYFLDKFEQEWF